MEQTIKVDDSSASAIFEKETHPIFFEAVAIVVTLTGLGFLINFAVAWLTGASSFLPSFALFIDNKRGKFLVDAMMSLSLLMVGWHLNQYARNRRKRASNSRAQNSQSEKLMNYTAILTLPVLLIYSLLASLNP